MITITKGSISRNLLHDYVRDANETVIQSMIENVRRDIFIKTSKKVIKNVIMSFKWDEHFSKLLFYRPFALVFFPAHVNEKNHKGATELSSYNAF